MKHSPTRPCWACRFMAFMWGLDTLAGWGCAAFILFHPRADNPAATAFGAAICLFLGLVSYASFEVVNRVNICPAQSKEPS